MSFIGGDIIEATYNHPTLGDGTLYFKGGEDISVNYGGYMAADDDAMVTGDGQMIDQINRKRWSFASTVAWDVTDVDELDNLQNLQNSPVTADWTFSHISGRTWTGNGKPVGDLTGAGQEATIPIKVAGGGQLRPI